MAKFGVLHDYDLMANREDSAQDRTCAVCDKQGMSFQWSDYHGEGMCTRCGCPYQLKGGTAAQESEGTYPYLSMREDFVPVAREYWAASEQFVYYGMGIGAKPGMRELCDWLRKHHPEFLKQDESA